MIDYLIDIDTQVFLFFHNLRTPFLDQFMWLFSKKAVWIPMYAAIFFYLVHDYGWRKAVVYLIALALTITLADQICASVIRPICTRFRPTNPGNPLSAMVTLVNGYRGGAYGFPSCHAANTFALASILTLISRQFRLAIFIFLWAIVTCYSRVYLGVHYPGDLLVGAIVGSLCGLLVYYIAVSVIRRYLPTSGGNTFRYRLTRIESPDVITIVGMVSILIFIVISLCKA